MNKLLEKLNKLKAFKDLNKQELSWVLYDVGNSAYTMLTCSLVPIWFKALACMYSVDQEKEIIAAAKLGEKEGELLIRSLANEAGLLSQNQATSWYGNAITVVTLAIALIGPICGAIADRKDTRKIFFTSTVAAGTIACILNSFASQWILFLVIYILAKVFYQASLTFYDSMINDVTTDDRTDKVSSYGYAWGYIGSCIPFLLALLAYILTPGADMGFNVFSDSLGKIIGSTITAGWWLFVSIPLIKNYKQINYVSDTKKSISDVFRQIGQTIKRIVKKDKKVLYFLIAFFLYIDGVNTIIDHCINLGTSLGLPKVGQVVFLLLTQVVAFGGSLVFSKLSQKKDTVSLIKICIIGYTCVCLYALTLQELWQFAIMAFGVGCFQGSIQSLSRSYFSRIIPDENSGEYFGIYDIFAKGASALGSIVISTITNIPGGNINIAVGSLATFFVLGYVFLNIADKKKQSVESLKDIV